MKKTDKKKYRLAFIVMVAFGFCCAGFLWTPTADAVVVDRIVAIVNDDVILLSELNEAIEPIAAQIRSRGYSNDRQMDTLLKVREQVLSQLIEQKLTDQEVKNRKISVSESEIDAAVERFKAAGNYSDDSFERALDAQGLTVEAYRQRMKDQILRARLLNREVRSKIVITEADIKEYYEANGKKYGGKKRYYLRNLMMPISSYVSESEKNRDMERMKEILSRMKAGQDFDKTGTEGRDLGYFFENQLSPQLQEALANLKPGDYTQVLDTDQGLQIFYLQDVETTPGKPLEDVEGEIRDLLYKEIVDSKFSAWLDELRKKSHIKMIK